MTIDTDIRKKARMYILSQDDDKGFRFNYSYNEMSDAFIAGYKLASEKYQNLSALDPVSLYEKLENERKLNEELQKKLDAAKIAYESNQKAAIMACALSDRNRELQAKMDEAIKVIEFYSEEIDGLCDERCYSTARDFLNTIQLKATSPYGVSQNSDTILK